MQEIRHSMNTYVVFDIETTGFSPLTCQIIEIGAVRVENGVITDRFSTFVNPKVPIPFQITQLTSITDQMVIGAPDIETVLPQFLEFIGDAALVAHNASFDVSFIEQKLQISGYPAGFHIGGHRGDGAYSSADTFKVQAECSGECTAYFAGKSSQGC